MALMLRSPLPQAQPHQPIPRSPLPQAQPHQPIPRSPSPPAQPHQPIPRSPLPQAQPPQPIPRSPSPPAQPHQPIRKQAKQHQASRNQAIQQSRILRPGEELFSGPFSLGCNSSFGGRVPQCGEASSRISL